MENINNLLKLSEEELYKQLGDALPATRSFGNLTDKGKRWIKNNKTNLAELICPKYKNLKRKTEVETITEIAATLGDVLAGGIPVFIVAALIVKLGLNSFCK